MSTSDQIADHRTPAPEKANGPTEEQIRDLAYSLYLERSHLIGQHIEEEDRYSAELEDWLRAEEKLGHMPPKESDVAV